ncbi:MAG TPA: cadmium resistance transporter [Methanobacterium sp.]|nr:cadmium resistance transporter [Methanobacterium sp.]
MDTILLFTAIFAFIATNLDDMFLLAAFFAHPDFQARNVFLGQYFGFLVLLLVSSLAYFAQFVIPVAWLSILGFIPMAIGIRSLIRLKTSRNSVENFEDMIPDKKEKTSNQMFQVSVVTVANGGDNLGVYMPLFATMNPASLLFTIVTFLFLVGVWCILGYKLVNNSIIGDEIKKYGHYILPFVMIFIGAMIMLKGWL